MAWLGREITAASDQSSRQVDVLAWVGLILLIAGVILGVVALSFLAGIWAGMLGLAVVWTVIGVVIGVTR